MRGSRPVPSGLVVAVLAGAVAACSLFPSDSARPTTIVAAETDSPSPGETQSTPLETQTVEPSPATSEPPPVTGIVPGSVNRTSLLLDASYDVKALLSAGSGRIEMATLLRVTNNSGDGIDRLELNTIAARLGDLRITEATVDDAKVRVSIKDQTLIVPLGGVLPDGGAAAVRIGYKASLRSDFAASNWMFTHADGVLALNRWIPWVSQAVPFARPNDAPPFVTPTSPRVDVEIVTDEPMDLASSAKSVVEVPAGAGRAWAFSVEDVRDLSVVLAPRFEVFRGEAKGVPIRAYVRPGSPNGNRLVAMAEDALRTYTDQLGVDYPWPTLSVVETEGGEGLETPGLIWVPRTKDNLNRTYVTYHLVAHQWFYGLVGSNAQADPFAGDGMSDLLARIATGTLRASRCPTTRLDRAVTAYAGNCYYEVVQVQGGLLLDDVRQRMGSSRFYAGVRAYLEANRFGIGGTRKLLAALEKASSTGLAALFRVRFPSLY
jgi:hypothetical protein